MGGDARAGSCMSPNGAINCMTFATMPTFATLTANGCCYTISPAVKNATYCYTFTSTSTSVQLNAGFSTTGAGGYAYYFDNFFLYTCAPSCTALPTYTTPYFTWTGLTIGQCYTFCFETHFSGGGPTGGFTKMCPYGLPITPLPIDLENFYAFSADSKVNLIWTTTSETNCMLYAIERSADGLQFETLAEVPGHGTTTMTQLYAFTDYTPLSGTAYYRLRTINMDLTEQYSHIISCTMQSTPAVIQYYALDGRRISLQDVPAGVYIQEIISGGKAVRQLYYHTL